MKRRPTRDDRLNLTAECAALWLPDEPTPVPQPSPWPDEPAMLADLGREGLEHAQAMRRRMGYGGLATD